MKKTMAFLKKELLLILGVILFVGVTDTLAQRMHGYFKANIDRDNYDRPIIKVWPTGRDMTKSPDTDEWGVYGILMCYKVNGEQKAERKDMTYDLMNEGEYIHVMSYDPEDYITDIEVEYFNAEQPSLTYPSKSSCY